MDLQQLLDEGIIDEVYQQLKTGKEAEVWLVSHRGEPVAAKLYKAREFRSFKNDAGYLEGRQVRNTRTQRAMDRGTSFGKQAAEEAWKSAEADALYALHAAGVRVPKPVLFYEGVLLMEVIGDHEGRVAPRLVDAGLSKEQALPLYELLRGEVIKMLAADYIHGDLSEFNILLGVNGPVIIDFPQTVAAARNSRSEPFFKRDLGNLIRFFSGLDPAVQKHQSDADEIWRAYVRRDLTGDFVPTGRPFQQHKPERGPFERNRGGPPRDGRPSGGRASASPGAVGAKDRRPGAERNPGGPRDVRSAGGSAPGGGGPPRDAPRGGPGNSRPGGPPRGGGGGPKRGPEVSYRGASQGPPRAPQSPAGGNASRQDRSEGGAAPRNPHAGERRHDGRPPHHRRHR
ncbi:MAG: RIO1 family regulatory kinase/ATPase [Myxococcaceae bacterium]|nr:RIO1 family regulatory kinase/ATPase [Myxococcaceae bacterium]